MTAMIPAVSVEPEVSSEYAASQGKGHQKVDWRQVGLAALLIGPNLLLLILFTYRPLVDNIRISFYNWNISSPSMTWVGLQNYIDWFQAPETKTIVWNTLVFTFCAVAGSMIIGLALAVLLDQKLFGRAAVRSIVFAPYVIAGAAIGVAFQFVFDPRYGLIQFFLNVLHIPVPNFYQNSGWALFMITVTYIWKNVGYVFVIYLAALQGRRHDLDEAAEIDGTPAARHFFRVVLPQLRGTTFFLLITVLLNSFQVFDVINAMTRGGPFTYGTTTMVFQVYTETFVNGRAGYGAAVATVMFLVVLVITVFQIKLQERLDK